MNANVVVNTRVFYGDSTAGQGEGRPYNKVAAFDFTDDFYREHGVNPDRIVERVTGEEKGKSVKYASPHADFTNVRILEITGGFSNNGLLMFYPINGKLIPESFTDNSAGKNARSIADEFKAFIFPKAKGGQLCPKSTNRRQDNMFDLANQYFLRNPLGLWHLTFVSYVQGASRKTNCRQMLDELKEKNGVDADGTPVIENLDEVNELERLGCVELKHRAADGKQGFPWVI